MATREEDVVGSLLRRTVAVAVGAVVLLMLAVPPVVSAGTRIEFGGVFYPCTFEPDEKLWIGGPVLHFRGGVNHNLWVTGNPLIDGFEDNVVNGDINLAKGTGVAHPRMSLRPHAVDGTWEVQVTVYVDPSGLTAQGHGRGTGDLHGLTMEFRHVADLALGPGENPCSDIPFAAVIEGSVQMPGSGG